ncbi:MAG TPA: protein translocase subunit SecF [Actinoplanes sp.]|nr:protein translocase subunit SecF [Actinoplanes sp.]
MARNGLAHRLYTGEAGLNIVGKRKMWFAIATVAVLVAIGSFVTRGFTMGIEFSGGNEFQVPVAVGTLEQAQDAVEKAVADLPAKADGAKHKVVSGQEYGNEKGATYLFRTSQHSAEEAGEVKSAIAAAFKIDESAISDRQVSAAWGKSVTQQALLGLIVFLVLVMVYLVLRFEWRMAIAAVSSLLLDLVLTAGVYSLVGFEVSPSTVIGFLTILGFSLYDVVVVFDKVQENTRGITAGTQRTYGEATNLAVNQTIMRSINTGLVALLPVGGLLFIGAGLLGAGTLKDLGLVLFVGMFLGVFSSIVFAAPVLTVLKEQEPRIKAHGQRVLARRAATAGGDVAPRATRAGGGKTPSEVDEAVVAPGATPRVGARPVGKRNPGNRGGRPGGAGNRPSGNKKR